METILTIIVFFIYFSSAIMVVLYSKRSLCLPNRFQTVSLDALSVLPAAPDKTSTDKHVPTDKSALYLPPISPTVRPSPFNSPRPGQLVFPHSADWRRLVVKTTILELEQKGVIERIMQLSDREWAELLAAAGFLSVRQWDLAALEEATIKRLVALQFTDVDELQQLRLETVMAQTNSRLAEIERQMERQIAQRTTLLRQMRDFWQDVLERERLALQSSEGET